MKAGKKGSAAIVCGSRRRTSPRAKDVRVDSDLALTLGRQPSSAADARIRARVCGATPGRSLNTNETSPLLTPACRATSVMVGLGFAAAPSSVTPPLL
jgi:hypothetical protein